MGTSEATALIKNLRALACIWTVLGAACGGRTQYASDETLDAAVDCGECDDGVPCTRDLCESGACAHGPDDAACEGETVCSVPACDPQAGCVGEPLPDGTWCGEPGADGAPPPVCDAGECLPQRVVGVYAWATMRVETPDLEADASPYILLQRVSDRDGDGVDDVAGYFGSVAENGFLEDLPGGVQLYSFPDGETIWALEPENGEKKLGNWLVCPGDLNDDGASDLLITVERDGMTWIRALDGSDGGTLWEIDADGGGLHLVGDLDGDGARDAATTLQGAGRYGSLMLTSSRSGDLLAVLEAGEETVRGYSRPTSVGDVDGDGVADFALQVQSVLERGRFTRVVVFSGATFSAIGDYDPPPERTAPLLALGDLTGDGRREIIVGNEGAGKAAVDLWAASEIWTLPDVVRIDLPTYDLDADGHSDFTTADWTGEHSDRSWRSAATGDVLFAAANIDEANSPATLYFLSADVPDVNADGAGDWLVADLSRPGSLLILATILEPARDGEPR